jgi:hypothetical protein
MSNEQIKIELPFTAKMSVDQAFQSVRNAVRSCTGTAETHEHLALALNVVQEQLVAFNKMRVTAAATAEKSAELQVVEALPQEPEAVSAN